LLRRASGGDLGHVYVPRVERLAERLSRDVERLAGAVASAALLVAGSMVAGLAGWRGVLGMVLLVAGILGCALIAIGAWWTSRQED
jgi:ubiquinone biosynthesis protein